MDKIIKYRKTDKYRATLARYRKTEKYKITQKLKREGRKEYMREYLLEYRTTDKFRKHTNDRYKNNVQFRISVLFRGRINKILSRGIKAGSSIKDLGCTLGELKKHLENQFKDGMTWENHGQYGWHIDHIKPLASFDLTDRKQFLEVVHFTNLQPLWAKENLTKGTKY